MQLHLTTLMATRSSLAHLVCVFLFLSRTLNSLLDKTCKLWSAETGQLYHTFRGHATEIVCLSFNPHGTMIATGSMDNTARIWDVESGECLHTLLGHTAEIVSLDFDTQGQRIITGSFDNTVKVWDVRNGRCIHTLSGHQGEISSCQFNYASDLCISGSIDRTCKVSSFRLCFRHHLTHRTGVGRAKWHLYPYLKRTQ
jgi:dynein assembly factor with WDR repeat domains 1